MVQSLDKLYVSDLMVGDLYWFEEEKQNKRFVTNIVSSFNPEYNITEITVSSILLKTNELINWTRFPTFDLTSFNLLRDGIILHEAKRVLEETP